MEKTCLEQLVKKYYEELDFANQSFDNIVRCYEAVIDHLFSDNIFNRGRFFIADYFTVYHGSALALACCKVNQQSDRKRVNFE